MIFKPLGLEVEDATPLKEEDVVNIGDIYKSFAYGETEITQGNWSHAGVQTMEKVIKGNTKPNFDGDFHPLFWIFRPNKNKKLNELKKKWADTNPSPLP